MLICYVTVSVVSGLMSYSKEISKMFNNVTTTMIDCLEKECSRDSQVILYSTEDLCRFSILANW